MGMKWEMESHDQPAVGTGLVVALQTDLWHDKSQLIFNQAACCAARYSPLSPVHCAKDAGLCWMKDSSTGISGSQHRSFVLPGMKEPSRIYWKGHKTMA